MGLGSDKETGKRPFVTAQRLNCGPKLSFLLSFLTWPVEWNDLCRRCRALLKCTWDLGGSTWHHQGHTGWWDDPGQSWCAHSHLSLRSAFWSRDIALWKERKFLEVHLRQAKPTTPNRMITRKFFELKEVSLVDLKQWRICYLVDRDFKISILKIMRNTVMVVNFHISQHGSRVEQNTCAYVLLIPMAAGQVKAGENTVKFWCRNC